MTPPARTVPIDVAAPLLLMSRLHLEPEEYERARELCGAVSDWPLLIDLARRKFSLSFVHRHLARLFPQGHEGVDLRAIAAELLPYTLRSLQVAAAQAAFHRDVVAPLGVAHAYLKGPSLAARYYGDLGIRFARDVDILVGRQDFAEVIHRAIAAGYRVVANPHTGRMASAPRDLRAQLRYQHVVPVLSRDGVLIEVHRQVDKNQGLFDEARILASAVEEDLQGTAMRTLPTDQLFLYVCYHSTRHTWSMLHWLADLDAMMHHSSFDRQAVLDLAGQAGMEPMIRACIELCAISRRLPLAADVAPGDRGDALLDLCLKNLEGDMEVELALRDRQVALELPFDWLLDPATVRRVRARRLWSRLAPSYDQYEGWPLPDALQWLYVPAKPLFWLKWHLLGRNR